MAVGVRVDFGSQAQVVWVELSHDPQGEVRESRPHAWVGKAGFPTERQTLELAAIEPIQGIHHKDGLQTILMSQDVLVVDIGNTGRCPIRAFYKINPGDILLEQHYIAMLPNGLIRVNDTLYTDLG